MNISISVAATPCAMPQIMFAGDLEARCALLAGLGYDGIDMFFPDPQCTGWPAPPKQRWIATDCGLPCLAAQGDLMADGLYLNDAGRLPELLERSKYHLEQCAVLGAMPNIGFIRGWHRNDPGSLPAWRTASPRIVNWRRPSVWTCSWSRSAVTKSTPSIQRIRPSTCASVPENPPISGSFSISSI